MELFGFLKEMRKFIKYAGVQLLPNRRIYLAKSFTLEHRFSGLQFLGLTI